MTEDEIAPSSVFRHSSVYLMVATAFSPLEAVAR